MLPSLRVLPCLAVATAALLLAGSAVAWAAGEGSLQKDAVALLDAALAWAQVAGAHIHDWIVTGYRRRPAVMIGLGGILVLPPLAIAGLALYRRRPPPAHYIATTASPAAFSAAAWVEIDGTCRVVMPAGRDILQIGRQDDNDICLDDEAVHRYHAVIERSDDRRFTITDVSGPEGNGVRVNGERKLTSTLAAGDMVELGGSRLRFATAV